MPSERVSLHRQIAALWMEKLSKHQNAVPSLERILDDVTPLYQSRTNQLAPQQRRIFAALASHWSPVDAATLARTLTSARGRNIRA